MKKNPYVSRLSSNTVFNTKIWEVENKVLNVSGLVTNTDFNTKTKKLRKILDGAKYITTSKFNNNLGEIFDERLKETQLATTNGLKIAKQIATKNVKKGLKTYDLGPFIGKSYFSDYG